VFVFLFTATLISLTGVMSPGPLTAAVLASGTRRRHAGAVVALGHAAVELPLMVVIVAGAGQLFQYQGVKTGIGLAGGAFLLMMGVQLLASIKNARYAAEGSAARHPFWTGIILTGANPYFLIWWATVGLDIALDAMKWGALVFALFAAVHWLCDLLWLEALSLASHKGTELLGPRAQQIVLLLCAALLLFFGGKFLYDAWNQWPPYILCKC